MIISMEYKMQKMLEYCYVIMETRVCWDWNLFFLPLILLGFIVQFALKLSTVFIFYPVILSRPPPIVILGESGYHF